MEKQSKTPKVEELENIENNPLFYEKLHKYMKQDFKLSNVKVIQSKT